MKKSQLYNTKEYQISDFGLDSGRITAKCPYCDAYEEIVLTDNMVKSLEAGEKIDHVCRLCLATYNLKY